MRRIELNYPDFGIIIDAVQHRLDANAVAMFVAVVDEGSFIGAARALAIPSSTLSRKLAELEDALGVQLLRRTTRQVGVTPTGRDFYERTKPIALSLEQVRSDLAGREQAPSGLLRVTSSPLLADLLLRAPIAEFLARHPRVEIELFLTHRLVNLLDEGFDVALRASELEDSSMVARRLAPSTHELCAAPAFFDSHGEPSHPRELARLPCFIYGADVAGNTWRFEHATHGRVAVTVHGPLRANDLRMGLEVVLAGRAIGNFPRMLVEEQLGTGALVGLLPGWSQAQRWIHALYPSRRHMSITLSTFLDFVATRLASAPRPARPRPGARMRRPAPRRNGRRQGAA
jgi:DNA-binding transcriptional LysR family regulator